MGPTRCTLVALGFKGSEWGSKFGPVANNDENIACGRQNMGMRLRNLRPYGRQRALSEKYSQWEAKFGDAASEFSNLREATDPISMSAMEACLWPYRCIPVALGFKGSEWGSKLGVPRLRDAVFG